MYGNDDETARPSARVGRPSFIRPMAALRRTARTAGLLYLTVIATGMLSLAYVPSRLIVADDPARTVALIVANPSLLQLGIAAGIVCYVAFLLLPLALHRLMGQVHREAGLIMIALAAVSVPISLVNIGHRFELLALATGDGGYATWSALQVQDAVTMSLMRYRQGLRIAMVFWGLWLWPLAYLILRTRLLPRVLGWLLLLGGAGYLVLVFGQLLWPAFAEHPVASWITLPATLGEIGTCLALLVLRMPATTSPVGSLPAT